MEYPELLVFEVGFIVLVTLALLWAVRLAWQGRLGVPWWWLLSVLFGGRGDAHSWSEPEANGRNWGGVIFWGLATLVWMLGPFRFLIKDLAR